MVFECKKKYFVFEYKKNNFSFECKKNYFVLEYKKNYFVFEYKKNYFVFEYKQNSMFGNDSVSRFLFNKCLWILNCFFELVKVSSDQTEFY